MIGWVGGWVGRLDGLIEWVDRVVGLIGWVG